MPEAPATDSLHGCRVLVARPAAQARTLCAMIEAAGGRARSLPLLEIAEVADPAAAAAQLAAARGVDRWIFSSTNAVRHAAALQPPPWPAAAAVGEATAAALEALGLRAVLRPEAGDGAAALLAHPALADVAGQRIALIAGEQPLPDLERCLRARGAVVDSIAVYRRLPVAHAPQAVGEAIADSDIAIVPSAEALRQLARLTPPEARAALLALRLALPSPRVVETARELGFRHTPLMPQRVSDAAYLDLLRGHCAAAPDQPSRIA